MGEELMGVPPRWEEIPLLVFPKLQMTGAVAVQDSRAVDKNGRPVATVEVRSGLAWAEPWDTDCHATRYVIPGFERNPRINKRGLEELARHGHVPELRWALVDVDWPGHDPVDPESHPEQLELILTGLAEAAIPRAAVYFTRGGYRLVWDLTAPVAITPDSQRTVEGRLVALSAGLVDARIPGDVDMACKDWTRLFRLPFVTRAVDGQAQPQRYLADLAGAEPLDLLQFEPRAKCQRRRTAAKDTANGSLVYPGGRNSFLASQAGRMRRAGLDEGPMLAALRQINGQRCRPPLSERELHQIAASVAGYSPGPEADTSDLDPELAGALVKLRDKDPDLAGLFESRLQSGSRSLLGRFGIEQVTRVEVPGDPDATTYQLRLSGGRVTGRIKPGILRSWYNLEAHLIAACGCRLPAAFRDLNKSDRTREWDRVVSAMLCSAVREELPADASMEEGAVEAILDYLESALDWDPQREDVEDAPSLIRAQHGDGPHVYARLSGLQRTLRDDYPELKRPDLVRLLRDRLGGTCINQPRLPTPSGRAKTRGRFWLFPVSGLREVGRG